MIKFKWADTLWWETTTQTRNYQLFSVTIRDLEKEDIQFLNIVIWRLNINIYYYWLEQWVLNRITKEAKEEPVQDS